jgi:TolB protein
MTSRWWQLMSLFGAITVGARASGPVLPVLGFEEFAGGTGGSVQEIVEAELKRSGRFRMDGGAAQWVVRAYSSAGRITGALLSAGGKVAFNHQYDQLDLRDNAHAFADDIVAAVTGEPGIALSRIAFVGDRGGAREIYVCDSDGQRIEQVTRERGVCAAPSLSPGAVFLSYTGYASGFADVWVVDLSEGQRRKVISAPGTNSGAVFSPDGTRLALTMSHGGNPDICVALPGGGRYSRVVASRAVESSPSWAPGGQHLVFVSDATGQPQLYVCSRRKGEPERLATGWAKCTGPDWSPDGQRIAFTGWRGDRRSVVIYDMETAVVKEVLGGAEDPSWAPDGRHLVAVQGGQNLVSLNTATGEKTRLVSGMGRLSEPSWSR